MLQHVAQAKYDNFFKVLLNDDWCTSTSGNVEAPCGFYGLLNVPTEREDRQWHEDVSRELTLCHVNADEKPDPGWYVLVLNSNGIIFAYLYSTAKSAKDYIAELDTQYMKWEDSDGE